MTGDDRVARLPGAADNPVLLHVPHAGRRIPGWVRERLLLDDAELAAELAALTDHHTDAIARAAAAMATLPPWVLINPVSRFVVDVERFPDGREEMAAVGMAAVYTRGTSGQRLRAEDPVHREALLAAHYRPWAAAVRELVQQRLDSCGRTVLIDVHSYPSRPLPYERHVTGPRPAVCLGVDPVHTAPWLVEAARRACAPIGSIAVNSPFRGTYVPLHHHGRDRRVASIMIELRRDTYLQEPAGPPTAGLAGVVRALVTLLDAAAAHDLPP
jgi:N-formylglutamate deformylase